VPDTWPSQDRIQSLLVGVLICLVDFSLGNLINSKVELSLDHLLKATLFLNVHKKLDYPLGRSSVCADNLSIVLLGLGGCLRGLIDKANKLLIEGAKGYLAVLMKIEHVCPIRIFDYLFDL
jgi:hypothetical protein